jgi:hypothetical protein
MKKGDKIVQEIISNPEDEGLPNELLREFQKGYPIENLRILMQYEDEQISKSAVWIASELGDKCCLFIEDIISFLSHRMKYIRFFAIDCILSCSVQDDGTGIAKAISLLEDTESSVRWKALHFLSRVTITHLEKGMAYYKSKHRDSLHTSGIQLLIDATNKKHEDIMVLLNNEIPLLRKYGVAAAARIFDYNPEFLRIAFKSNDLDIKEFAEDFLRFK